MLGLTSSGLEGRPRATRNAASAPPTRTTTMIANAKRFLRARMVHLPRAPESDWAASESSFDIACGRGRSLDAGAEADAAQSVTEHPEARQARQGVVHGAHAREVAAIVLRNPGPGAEDPDQVGIAPEAGHA